MRVFLAALLAAAAAGAASAASAAASPAPSYRFLVFREDCLDTFFVKGDLLNRDCLKATVAKGLGVGLIAGACVVKLPQALSLLSAAAAASAAKGGDGSGAGGGGGLPLPPQYMELASCLLAVVWHLWKGSEFTTFGESVIVALGTVVIILILWATARPRPSAAHMLAATAALGSLAALAFVAPQTALAWAAKSAVGAGLATPSAARALITPKAALDALQMAGAALFASSRMAQIAQIAMTGTTGSLSAITLFLNFAGTAARVFTSAAVVGDDTLLASAILNAALNGTVLAQWVGINLLGMGGAVGGGGGGGVEGAAAKVPESKKGK